jgi:predicted DNA-binding WGR domain protein
MQSTEIPHAEEAQSAVSKHAPRIRNHPGGCAVPLACRLERIDPERRMARYYALSIELTLFGDVACARRYGPIGRPGGRILLGLHETRADAEAELGRLLARKLGRGYVLRES